MQSAFFMPTFSFVSPLTYKDNFLDREENYMQLISDAGICVSSDNPELIFLLSDTYIRCTRNLYMCL